MMIIISTQTYMADIIFPQLLTVLYHRTSKKMHCGNILPCCSNLSLIHLCVVFFLTPLKHRKGNTISVKTLLRWSFCSFNTPFLRVRVLNFEKEQQPSLPPCPSLTTRPKQEAEVHSHPSLFSPLPLQLAFPCSWPAPPQALPSNLCPQRGCTGVTNCHLANHSGLPRDQTPACSPSTVSALQGQNYRHVPSQLRTDGTQRADLSRQIQGGF